MNPWTDKQLYGHTECRKKRRKDRWMSRGKDRQQEGRKERQTNRGKDRQKEGRKKGRHTNRGKDRQWKGKKKESTKIYVTIPVTVGIVFIARERID